MAEYSQENQPLKIFTDLPDDDLLLTRFQGEEGISRPFRFALELVSVRTDINARELLRRPAVITFPLHDGSTRTIHGLFRRFAQTGMSQDLAQYRAEIVAWPWFLTLRRRRRVFQEMSILEIAEEIFGDWEYSDFAFKCANRAARKYVVQYDETDWDFISRWLEAEGIFYFFEHSEQGHTLVLADGNSQVPACPEISEALFRSESVIETDVVRSVVWEHQVQVGAVALRDYDYLQPSFPLETSLNGAPGADENYDYPGDFTKLDDGDRYARYRLEAEEARQEEIEGSGNCRWMVSGHSFELDGHFNSEVNGEYLITAVRHQCGSGAYRSGEGDHFAYQNTFHCIPATVPFRPLRTTPRPSVRGTQTAVVVGPSGEEVWTDKHGRVKIQFHWDREGESNENSSCWVRVSSPWAGKGWGFIEIPRIDQEVLVGFQEGDPDRPIVVGSVYNAEQTPPWDLPDSGTISGVKSRSSKGGGGYNEFSLEDQKGSELINIHAQKNMTTRVLNDQSTTVHNDQKITVDNDRTITVTGERSETVTKDTSLEVTEGDYSRVIASGKSEEYVKGNRGVKVDGQSAMEFKGDSNLQVTEGDFSLKAKAKKVLIDGKAGVSSTSTEDVTLSGKNVKSNADMEVTVDGQSIKLTGKTEITLSVGANFVKIDPSGVTIFGTIVKIN